jgi:hypothetical protein
MDDANLVEYLFEVAARQKQSVWTVAVYEAEM